MQGAPKRRDGEETVPFPPLKADTIRRSTVLPYLEAFHYANDNDIEDVYYTEHDMNRKYTVINLNAIAVGLSALTCVLFQKSMRNKRLKPRPR